MQKFLNTVTTKLPGWLGALLLGAPFLVGVIGESTLAEVGQAIEPTAEPKIAERVNAADVEWAEGFRLRYAANSLYE